MDFESQKKTWRWRESFENQEWNAENILFYDNEEDGTFSDEKYN